MLQVHVHFCCLGDQCLHNCWAVNIVVGVPALYLAVVVPLGFLLVDENGNPHYGSPEA